MKFGDNPKGTGTLCWHSGQAATSVTNNNARQLIVSLQNVEVLIWKTYKNKIMTKQDKKNTDLHAT